MEIFSVNPTLLPCRLSSLLSEREGGSSGQSGRDAQIKLKALNKATVKMAAQLEELEQQNAQLLSKLQAVSY